MRIVEGQFQELTEETARFARQLGVNSVQFNTPLIPGEERWEYEDLLALRRRCEDYGLRLEAIENVPMRFYDHVMLGLPKRDEQIDNYRAIIRNMGKAGIPLLGHHFIPTFVWRTSRTAEGRGGAKTTEFDLDLANTGRNALLEQENSRDEESGKYMVVLAKGARKENDFISEADLWENYRYFMKAVLPAAEESGVRLALHPDDPPVRSLGGTDRLFYNAANLEKAMDVASSDAWGVNLCLGCCSEMVGGAATVIELIRFFGPRKKIFCVHFRDVQGTVPRFKECFLGEGNFDPAEVMLELIRTGYDGIVMDDHVPQIVNDTDWGHRGRAYEVGYLQGLMKLAELAGKEARGVPPATGAS